MNQFIFVACQAGAEQALKNDLAKYHPELSFAFSRAGFVTFKVADGAQFDVTTTLKSAFARTYGQSVGSVKESSERISQLVALLPEKTFKHLHVWARDRFVPGERQYEPFHTSESLELGQQIKSDPNAGSLKNVAVNRTAKNGDYVVDLAIVEPDLWFVGWHQAATIPSRWPGGVPPIKRPDNMVSRAYLKMEEALRWSRLPIVANDLCVELGSSPGGSCQCLLDRDFRVLGIDPARMDERVLSHPNFVHARARAADIKRKEFADARWLMSDANLAPESTLEAIEDIVTNRHVKLAGMLITLKLLDPSMAELIPTYLQRIGSWGFRHVRARQLAFNRQEICVMAVRSKSKLKFGRKRKDVEVTL